MKVFALVLVILAATALAQDSPPPPLLTIPPTVAPVLAPPLPVTPPTVAPPTVAPPTVAPTVSPPRVAPTVQPPAPGPRATPPTVAPTPARGPSLPPAASPPPGAPAASPPSGSTPAAAAVVTPSSSGSGSGPSGSGPSEADVLTFAYNLEFLEGQFYSCAAFGTALPSNITGNGPAPSSCKKANLTADVQAYASELSREETAHVTYLYQALKAAGGSPVCPQVNIDTAFEKAAEAAFNSTTALDPTFDPYANDAFFLHGSFIFEDLGASAYNGGVAFLSTPAYRAAATAIGNAESYHSGIIRTLLYANGYINSVPAYNSTVAQITTAITRALNTLTGTPQLKYTLTNVNGTSLANVDSQAFVPAATPAQVLKAVTLGAQAGSGGGFFPSNTNGNIKN